MPHPDALRRIESVDLPAIVISRDYRVLATNQAYRQRYGAQVEVSRDRCHWVSHRFETPCDQNGESCPLAVSVALDAPASVTHVHHTPRGTERCDIRMEPVRDDTGQIVQFVEIIRPLDPRDEPMLGRSPAMQTLHERLERVAPTDLPVLLLGETGTGKELAARALHRASARSSGPFVPVECSGLSPTLFESELFGHERGAFTGAERRREGLLDAARGGTLFLDEIGDVPLEQQVKLLRVLERGTYRRVGGRDAQSADFRLVCATHAPLAERVRQGTFRRDLYYRIRVFPLQLPPLRDRGADVVMLATSFLREVAPDKRLRPDAVSALLRQPFPGNVRELRHLIQRAALLADGDWVHAEHVHLEDPVQTQVPGYRLESLEQAERRYLAWAETQVATRAELARVLQVSERTLYRKLSKQ